MDVVEREIEEIRKEKERELSNLRREIAAEGGKSRAESLSPERRREIRKKAAEARWSKRNESALSEQVGDDHYKRFKIQPVEFTYVNGIPAIEASVIWYVCRHREKNGAEDLDKAIHFLRILKELEYGKKGGA